jgi:protein-disulfide isomerase
MKERLLNAVTALMVTCALVVTGLVVQREVEARQKAAEAREGRVIENWQALVARPQFASTGRARVTLAVFADYTCRYCKQLEGTLDSVRARFGDDLAVVHQHFPIYMGSTPYRMAIAAECAAEQGRLQAYHDLLYENQSRLEIVPLDSLAAVSGIADLQKFTDCVQTDRTATVVRENRARGDELGVTSTPTMVINGRLFVGAVTPEVLADRVAAAIRESGSRGQTEVSTE